MFDNQRLTDHIDSLCAPEHTARRRADGSIDFDHYRRIGRATHGAAVRFAFRRAIALLGRSVGGLYVRRPRPGRRSNMATAIVPAE